MKVLLLMFMLGLACTHPCTIDYSKFSGEWKTLYLASSDPAKISKDAPLRVFFRDFTFDSDFVGFSVNFAVTVDGECQTLSISGKRSQGNYLSADYEGKNVYHPTYVSDTSMVGYVINTDENGDISLVTLFLGRGNEVDELGFAKFKEITLQLNILEANIVDLVDSDNCP